MGDLTKHFSRHEFACQCGCGFDSISIDLISVLETVREFFGTPILITSGCRCEKHNKKEGGEKHSKHLEGIAVDFIVGNVEADLVAEYLEKQYPDKFGIGRYNGRTHLDIRPNKARWDRR